MKKHFKKITNAATSFFKQSLKRTKVGRDQRGQGMTEYALLLLVIVALVTLFRDNITDAVQGKLDSVTSEMGQFQGGK